MDPEIIEAVKTGDVEKVNELLKGNPALAKATDEAGVSAVLLALYYNRGGVLDALLAAMPDLDIHEACAVGDVTRVAALAASDAQSVNSYSPDGFFPLGLAAFFGRLDVVQFLLDHGADPNAAAKNPMRVRAIHAAVAHRQPAVGLEMAKALLAHDADVNTAQQAGWTPLHQAAAHGHDEMVNLLLAHGADINARNDEGKSPMDMAVEKGFHETAERLRTHRE